VVEEEGEDNTAPVDAQILFADTFDWLIETDMIFVELIDIDLVFIDKLFLDYRIFVLIIDRDFADFADFADFIDIFAVEL